MTKRGQIEIRIPTEAELLKVRQLRYEVLDKPIGVSQYNMPSKGDSAKNVIHMAAFDGDSVVCTVRLDEYGNGRYLVRRMATEPEFQGLGIGKCVLEAAEIEARKLGAVSMVLHSRKTAIGFYEKQGYTLTGKLEIHDGDKNLEMIKAM